MKASVVSPHFSFRDGELLVKSDKVTPTWDGKVARLELDNLEISDSGIYTCIAENEIGKTRCSAELSVLNTPDISDAELQPPVFETGLPNRITIREGITYEMTVKIAGKFVLCMFFYDELRVFITSPDNDQIIPKITLKNIFKTLRHINY